MLKIWFLLCVTVALAKALQPKPYVKFTDTITVRDKILVNARMTGDESVRKSFLWAVCEDTQSNQQRFCNFTIQKEVEKLTCPVLIAPDNPENERLPRALKIYPLNDDKVAITWWNNRRKVAHQFRILEMSTCKLLDVALPASLLVSVVAYNNAVDLGFWNETSYFMKIFKITISADGKHISGPTDILKDVKVTYIEPIGPVNENEPEQGFYAQVGSKTADYNFYKINRQGESVRIATIEKAEYGRFSNSHNLFSICHTFGGVKSSVICAQYDRSSKLKFTTNIEFLNGNPQHWFQPYNLKNGGLLLVSGQQCNLDAERFDTFSITKIRHNGEVDRGEPATEVDNLNFTCPGFKSMNVNVLEKESGEICTHFSCTRAGTDDGGQKTNTLQLAVICLPKA